MVTFRVSKETSNLVDQAKEVYLRFHPDLKGVNLSKDKVINKLATYYIKH